MATEMLGMVDSIIRQHNANFVAKVDRVDRVLDDALEAQSATDFGAGVERDLLKCLKFFVAAIDGNRDPKVARSLALRLGRLESLTMQVRDLASAAWERTE